MRRPHAAAAAVALLLWLAVLTVAFHGCGSGNFSGCGRTLALVRRNSVVVSLPRKMLLAVASLDVPSSSSPTADRQDQHRHHRHNHQHHHHHHHHHHQHKHHAKWNRQGIPPSAAPTGGKAGGETDPRYGVQKRVVPTGPNPLHH